MASGSKQKKAERLARENKEMLERGRISTLAQQAEESSKEEAESARRDERSWLIEWAHGARHSSRSAAFHAGESPEDLLGEGQGRALGEALAKMDEEARGPGTERSRLSGLVAEAAKAATELAREPARQTEPAAEAAWAALAAQGVEARSWEELVRRASPSRSERLAALENGAQWLPMRETKNGGLAAAAAGGVAIAVGEDGRVAFAKDAVATEEAAKGVAGAEARWSRRLGRMASAETAANPSASGQAWAKGGSELANALGGLVAQLHQLAGQEATPARQRQLKSQLADLSAAARIARDSLRADLREGARTPSETQRELRQDSVALTRAIAVRLDGWLAGQGREPFLENARAVALAGVEERDARSALDAWEGAIAWASQNPKALAGAIEGGAAGFLAAKSAFELGEPAGERMEQRLLARMRALGLSQAGWRLLAKMDAKDGARMAGGLCATPRRMRDEFQDFIGGRASHELERAAREFVAKRANAAPAESWPASEPWRAARPGGRLWDVSEQWLGRVAIDAQLERMAFALSALAEANVPPQMAAELLAEKPSQKGEAQPSARESVKRWRQIESLLGGAGARGVEERCERELAWIEQAQAWQDDKLRELRGKERNRDARGVAAIKAQLIEGFAHPDPTAAPAPERAAEQTARQSELARALAQWAWDGAREGALGWEEEKRDRLLDWSDWIEGDVGAREALPRRFGVSALSERSRAWHEELARQQAVEAAERELAMASQRKAEMMSRREALLSLGHAGAAAEMDAAIDAGAWPMAIGQAEGASLEAEERALAAWMDDVAGAKAAGASEEEARESALALAREREAARAAGGSADAPSALAGWTATGLATAADLGKEGAAMNHCVATYARQCIEGRSRIFRVQSPDGKPVGTLELSVYGLDKPRAEVAQFRGSRNAAIGDPAAKRFAQAIAKAYERAARANRERLDASGEIQRLAQEAKEAASAVKLDAGAMDERLRARRGGPREEAAERERFFEAARGWRGAR
jgi:hypothetical protein